MRTTKVKGNKLETLREEYFNSLPEFQELFLELMLPNANHYLLMEGQEDVGYAIITAENTLIEFFIKTKHVRQCQPYFSQIIEDLQVSSILCKSFDALLLNCCLLQQYSYTLIGCLFRDYQAPRAMPLLRITRELADDAATELIKQQQDCFEELFETEEYLSRFLREDDVFLFYQDKILVGCGTVIRTHPKWDYCDLGVWVHANFRKQGIGAHILSELRTYAIEKGLKPSCGCAIENIASQKAIEKAGFVSRYKMIEFQVNR